MFYVQRFRPLRQVRVCAVAPMAVDIGRKNLPVLVGACASDVIDGVETTTENSGARTNIGGLKATACSFR